MPRTSSNGDDGRPATGRELVPVPHAHAAQHQQPRPNGHPGDDLLAEAESLRGALQVVLARATRLVAALKHQRRQTRALQAAAASLRQFDPSR